MLYDLNNPLDAENYKLYCNKMWEKKNALGRRVVVEVTEKCGRTIKQNSYLHLILSYFAAVYGADMEYVKKEYFKETCNADIFVQDKFVDPITQKLVTRLKSSGEISKEDMTTCIDRFKKWSVEVAGIYLPDANKPEEIIAAEVEINRNKRYMV